MRQISHATERISERSGWNFVMNVKPMIRRNSTAARLVGLVVVAVTLFGVAGCSKLKARDLLNKGVAAFKNGQYDTAVEDFKQAKELNPALIVARLYLAT